MPKSDWISVYSLYEDAELEAEIADLKDQARNPYASQGQGSQSYQRSMGEMRNRLAAASEVKLERANRNSGVRRHGQADFSNVRI